MKNMLGEISLDILIEDDRDRDVMEGCYRIEQGEWHIFYFTRWWREGPKVILDAVWRSGVSGVNVNHPKDQALNKIVVKERLSEILKGVDWVEVKGPDSLQLK